MYSFAERPIDKLLKVTLRATDDLKPKEILAAITRPLASIAIARLILSRVTPPVGMIDAVEKRCRITNNSVIVDLRALISDSINGAGRFADAGNISG